MVLTRTSFISLMYSVEYASDINMFVSASLWLTAGRIWDAYQPYFSSQCLTWALGQHVAVWFKAPLPKGKTLCPNMDLVHIRLTSWGACGHHALDPLPLSSLIHVPQLHSWHSLAPAWLREQWIQLQKSICFIRSFPLVLFFTSLVSIKFHIVVSLGEVLPGGNIVLQSEYFF